MNAMRTVALKVDELQRSLAFISISTDGDVLLWTLAKSLSASFTCSHHHSTGNVQQQQAQQQGLCLRQAVQ
jgi:hypothetical protein